MDEAYTPALSNDEASERQQQAEQQQLDGEASDDARSASDRSDGSDREEEDDGPTLNEDLAALSSAASSSFWGFVSSASSALQHTRAAVRQGGRKLAEQASEFKKTLKEENPTMFSEEEAAEAAKQQRKQAGASLAAPPAYVSLPSDSSAAAPAAAAPSDSLSSWSASSLLSQVERAGDGLLNKTLNLIPASVWALAGDDEEEDPQQADGKSTEPFAGATPASARMRNARLAQMESQVESFTLDPADPSDPSRPSPEYRAWFHAFHTDFDSVWSEEVAERRAHMSLQLRDMHSKLVLVEDGAEAASSVNARSVFGTARMPEQLFFCRYLYRLRLIEAEEARRHMLLGKISAAQTPATAQQPEDDLSWGEDDSSAPTNMEAQSSATAAAQATPQLPAPVPVTHAPVAAAAPKEESLEPVAEIAQPLAAAAAEPLVQASAAPLVAEQPPLSPSPSPSPSFSPPLPVSPPLAAVDASPAPLSATPVAVPLAPVAPAPAAAASVAAPLPAAAAAAVSAVVAPAPLAAVAKKVETKEEMRARIELDARERVLRKLAEKKAQRAAEEAAKSAVNAAAAPATTLAVAAVAAPSAAATSSIPPAHPVPHTSSSSSSLVHADHSAHLAPNFSSTIALLSPSPPLLASSRSSSNTSQEAWIDVEGDVHTPTAAAQTAHKEATHAAPAPAAAVAVTATAPAPAAVQDDWQDWE